MNDLISRQAAIDAVLKRDANCGIDAAEILETLSTVDAVPVVHGQWKRKIVDCGFNADWVCSQCGHRVMTDFVSYKYCPNCGAKMDGKDGDNG